MKLKSISAWNFMSYKHLNIAFEEGIYFILGKNQDDPINFESNGAGKSAIVDALSFALFGEVIREKVPIDQIINDQAGKNLKVEIRFEQEEKLYKIQRYKKDDTYKNEVFVYKNSIEDDNLYKDQTTIDKIIGFNHKMFLDFVAIGQETKKMFAAKTDKEMQESLEVFLNLDIWDKSYEESQNKIKETEISLKDLENQIARCFSDILQAQNTLDGISLELFKVNKLIDDSQYAAIEIEKEIKNLNFKIKDCPELEKELSKVNRKKQELEIKLIEYENDIVLLDNELPRLEEQMTVKGQPCPLCHRLLDQDLAKEETIIQIVEVRRAKTERMELIDIIKRDIELKRKEIKKLEIQKENQKENELLKYQLIALHGETEKIKSETKIYESNRKKYSDDSKYWAKIHEDKVEEKETLEEAIENKARQIKVYIFLKKSFKEIKTLLLNRTFNFLNERLKIYNQKLTGGRYSLYFKKTPSLKTKFLIFDNLKQQEFSYFRFSGGEKGRDDIALCLSLQDLFINQIGFRIFDDIFGRLDSKGIENVCDLLKDLSGLSLVICQNDLSEYFDKIISVEKKGGESKACII